MKIDNKNFLSNSTVSYRYEGGLGFQYIVGAISVAMLGYLLVSIIWPEKF